MIIRGTRFAVFLFFVIVVNRSFGADVLGMSQSFEGPFDHEKAMQVIYTTVQPPQPTGHEGSLIWRGIRVPKLLAKYFRPISEGKVSILFDASYIEHDVQKHILITETVPTDEEYNCHACGSLIGGAVFRLSGELWNLEAVNRYITVMGKLGTAKNENMRLVKTGPAKHGVIIQGGDIHMGFITDYVSLIMPYGKSLTEVLNFFVEGVSEGGCLEDEEPEGHSKFEAQGIEVRFDESNNEVQQYDVLAAVRYNSGNCDKFVPIRETRLFRFQEGRYKRKN